MAEAIDRSSRRRWACLLGAAGVACAAIAWNVGPRSLALAQGWIDGVQPIGEFYGHSADEFPFPHLGDVPPDLVEPRSLGDIRVRQYDELDRPRFRQRLTHRSAQLNAERFTVVALSGEEDASLASSEFNHAWDEFSRLADTFTDAHRNPDFGIGQLLIVIDNEPVRQRDTPARPLQFQNGQVIVYLNVADGQPPLEEQLGDLRQGAVHALLHLAELDRKFPLWVQQGLAEYTAAKIEQADDAAEARAEAEDAEGFEPDQFTADEFAEDGLVPDEQDDDSQQAKLREQSAFAGLTPIGTEYWRLQRVAPDRLAADDTDGFDSSEAVERVAFLLEGDDAEHAPAFLLSLRMLAEEATDSILASRAQLSHTQLLRSPTDTIVDELAEELDDAFAEWQQDPLRGQPLFVPGGDIPDPGMLAREKEMEVILKLAARWQQVTTQAEIQPRFTEFGPEGQREVTGSNVAAQAIDVEQLYYNLIAGETPWATRDANGQLLLWTDEEQLAEVLGLREHRYAAEYRDGRWVLVTAWNDDTQLEAWLEPNEANPSRPLVKFNARPKVSQVRVAELGAGALQR